MIKLLIATLLFLVLQPAASAQLSADMELGYAQSVFSSLTLRDLDGPGVGTDDYTLVRDKITSGFPIKGGLRYDFTRKFGLGMRGMYFSSLPHWRTTVISSASFVSARYTLNVSIGPSLYLHLLERGERWRITSRFWFPIQVRALIVSESFLESSGIGGRSEYEGRTRIGLETALLTEYHYTKSLSFGASLALHASSFNSRALREFDLVDGKHDRSNPTRETVYADIGKRLPLSGPASAGSTWPFSHLALALSLRYTPDFSPESDQRKSSKHKRGKHKRGKHKRSKRRK